jgi:N-acetylglutamate synthase-like GNAT family acetyltransferase
MGFSLRPAAKKDQPEIRKLVLAGGINPSGLDWQRFFVAEDQAGKVIGCAQLKPHRDGSVELASLVVVEDQRGKGVARALIEHLVRLQNGTLYLMCRSGLGPLYEKFGFTTLEEEEMPKYFRRVSKLFGKIEPFRKGKETLLVMRKLQGEAGS